MEEGLVPDPSSTYGGGFRPPTRPNFRQLFEEALPYYISIGMTPDQYWNGDPSLVRAYREADRLRSERENFYAWLHGLYNYEALCAASPIFRALAKRNTRPAPYVSEPHPITKRKQEDAERVKEKQVAEKGMAKMEAWAAAMRKRAEAKTTKENKEA